MNRTLQILRSLWRPLCAAALAVPLLGIQGLASAAQPPSTMDRTVALEFDNGTGTLLKATEGTLSRSSDQGRTWTPISLPASMARTTIATVAVSDGDKGALYVAGRASGVLRSKDGGRSWVPANKGLPKRGVSALATHAGQPDTVYAHVTGKGFFRSQDGGANWRLMDRGPREKIVHFVHSSMPGSMETGWLFAGTPDGVRRSMDCFCGWHKAGELAGKITAVAYDPDQPQRVYVSTAKGLFVSADGGEQWSSMKSPEATITALAAAPSGVLYAAGNGSLYRSGNRGETWEKIDA